jgi:hypothetical protein
MTRRVMQFTDKEPEFHQIDRHRSVPSLARQPVFPPYFTWPGRFDGRDFLVWIGL